MFLRLIDEFSMAQISAWTGASPSTVKRGAERERARQEAEGEQLARAHSELYCAFCSAYFDEADALYEHLSSVHKR
jgi:hypothetical protein